MSVAGLNGTLAPDEVEQALAPRATEFGRCFTPHMRRLRTLGGRILLAFHVGRDGHVMRVYGSDSTVGHREVERCVMGVAAETQFPAPHGGEADFSWPLELDPPNGVRLPITWDPSRVAGVVRRRAHRVLEECGHGGFQVTTYVSRRGRVLAAGAAVRDAASLEHIDCVIAQVRRWRMPRPDAHQAKVTFDLTAN